MTAPVVLEKDHSAEMLEHIANIQESAQENTGNTDMPIQISREGAAAPGSRSRIRLLPPEEARKIAAGEVIDRPAALVREFVDNAIDAGGSRIEVFLEEGGILKTEVIDDGGGMEKEDMELCWHTHATSKIHTIDDLDTAETLGFRGEALAAAAAVSRLEILSSANGTEAWLLETGGGRPGFRLSQSRRVQGTSVRALGLFDTIPVRKRFLKRDGAEGALCRQVFIDKALAFPGLNFRLTQDGRLDLFLPAAGSFKERFALALLSRAEGAFLHEISAQGQGFSVVIVFGGPELFRRDRRRQYIFANGRRISDFSLIQALEYGLQGWFPNTAHPMGALYIDIDPVLADFNIHPAKREVRFREPGAIHHAITTALRDFTRRGNYAGSIPREPEIGGAMEPAPGSGAYSRYGMAGPDQEGGRIWPEAGLGLEAAPRGQVKSWAPAFASSSLAMEALLESPPSFVPPPRESPPASNGEGAALEGESVCEQSPAYPQTDREPRFVGRLFSLFILVEWGDRLFIIDQHAAHERILYDRFIAGDIPKQELLVPIPFATESEEDDRFLQERRKDLAKLGVLINADDRGGSWRIEALPVNWRLSDGNTVREILALRNAGEDLAERWAAALCCHNALKDGDYLDTETALALAQAALRLPIPRCPHGRPIWKELSREELFRAVRRNT